MAKAARRGFLATLLALPLICAAFPATAAELREGRDFRQIVPPLATERNKIEVTEFFWYGCPHCFDFEAVLADWTRTLPPDVSFRRVPAILGSEKWIPGARLYYTLEAMNLVEKLHREAFNAIHVERLRLGDEKVLFDWVAKKGVDAKAFSATWSSFAVQSQVQQAHRLSQAARLTGVPSIIVNGRYLAITPGSYGELVTVVDRLIAAVRAEAGQK